MNRLRLIEKFYEEGLYNKNIPDYEKLHWESEWSQKIRFEMFLKNIHVDNNKLLDVGCGLGNLFGYMKEENLIVDYSGVDILKHMIIEAKERYPEAKFYTYDIFKEHPFKRNSFDIVYASGIFNLNLGNNKKFLMKAIKEFLFLSNKYVAFNLLHENSPKKEKKFFYFEPAKVVKMIEETHTEINKIEILEHYLKNDFTIICEKY